MWISRFLSIPRGSSVKSHSFEMNPLSSRNLINRLLWNGYPSLTCSKLILVHQGYKSLITLLIQTINIRAFKIEIVNNAVIQAVAYRLPGFWRHGTSEFQVIVINAVFYVDILYCTPGRVNINIMILGLVIYYSYVHVTLCIRAKHYSHLAHHVLRISDGTFIYDIFDRTCEAKHDTFTAEWDKNVLGPFEKTSWVKRANICPTLILS